MPDRDAMTDSSTDPSVLFKALAHPRRLAILALLREGERCVCEIEATLRLRQAYVSQQLTVLREAGLVCYRKDGLNVRYRIAHPEVFGLIETATAILGQLGPCALIAPDEVEQPACSRCPGEDRQSP